MLSGLALRRRPPVPVELSLTSDIVRTTYRLPSFAAKHQSKAYVDATIRIKISNNKQPLKSRRDAHKLTEEIDEHENLRLHHTLLCLCTVLDES